MTVETELGLAMPGCVVEVFDEKEQDLKTWHAARSKGIGGSEAAAVLRMSPYVSPLELWALKTGKIERLPFDRTQGPAYWGTVLEPVVRDEAARRTGLRIVWPGVAIYSKPDHPFNRASPDGFVFATEAVTVLNGIMFEGPGLYEGKTADMHLEEDWGEQGTATIPQHYYIQVQHNLAATGLKWALVAVLIGGNDFRWYIIKRDAQFIDEDLLPAEREFWGMVQTKKAPEAGGSDSDSSALLRLWKTAAPPKEIDLPGEALEWDATLTKGKAQIKELESKVDDAKNKIIQAMGDAAVGKLPGGGKYTLKKTDIAARTQEVRAYSYLDLRRKK
jgi:putative phage-type endonuclease